MSHRPARSRRVREAAPYMGKASVGPKIFHSQLSIFNFILHSCILHSQLFAVPSTTRQMPWVSAVVLMSS